MQKVYCFKCDKDVEPLLTTQNNTYIIRNQKVNVLEQVYNCSVCGTELINDNLNESLYKIYDAYLNIYGLSFKKLKEIRNSYNLSQDLFAKALGFSKRTIIRYEQAESLPQKQALLTYKKIENNKAAFL